MTVAPSPAQPFPRQDWMPILVGTVLLPAGLAGFGAVTTKFVPSSTIASGCFAAASLIVQMGIAGWVVSKLSLPRWLRNVLYAWCVTLIDVNVFASACQLASEQDLGRFTNMLPAAALFAGQIGGITAFAILGRGMWFVRILYCSIAVWCIWCAWRFCSSGSSPWNNIIALQTLSVALLCLSLRLAGFSFLRFDTEDAGSSQQFSISHVVFTTTFVAVLLAMGQAGAPLLSNSVSSLSPRQVLLAISAALCMGVAMWAALGRESPMSRLLLYVAVACVCGVLFGIESGRFLAIPGPWTVSREWYYLAQVRMWWVAWFLIAPAILSAVLLFFRLTGWQLGRPLKA